MWCEGGVWSGAGRWGGGVLAGGVMGEAGMVGGGRQEAMTALGRRGRGACGAGRGNAAGAVRLCVCEADAWRACGVEGGGSHQRI